MARIPDAQDLGPRPIPRAARGIVQDRSGDIEARGVQNLAQGIGNVSDAGYQIQQREDKFNYARAKSALLQSDVELRKSLENDPDFSTYEKRYTEGMNKARGSATELIKSQRDRSLFELDSDMDVSRGTESVRQFAKKKEADWGRSTLDETLEGIRRSAIESNDEAVRMQAINTAKDMIIGAQESGYMSREEATNKFQGWRDNSVMGYVEAQQPDKQIEILNSKGVADYLQPDVRAKMLKVAQNQGDSVKAQAYAETAITKHDNMLDALSAARKDLQGPVQTQAVAEIKQIYAEREAAKQQAKQEISTNSWSTVMDTGKMPVGKQLSRLRETAPEEERQMRDWLLAKTTRGPETDLDKWSYLNELSASDPVAFGEIDLRKFEPYLSTQDFKAFGNKQSAYTKGDLKAMQSGAVFKSTMNLIKNEVLASGIDLTPKEGTKQAKDLALFAHSLQQSLDTATEKKGGALNADEARTIGMNQLREKIEQGSGFLGFGGTKKRAYQVAPDEAGKFVASKFDDIPRQYRDALWREYDAMHPESVDPENTGYMSPEKRAAIERAYSRGVEAGRFK